MAETWRRFGRWQIGKLRQHKGYRLVLASTVSWFQQQSNTLKCRFCGPILYTFVHYFVCRELPADAPYKHQKRIRN